MSSDSHEVSASLNGVEIRLRLDDRGRVIDASHRGASPELSRLLDLLGEMGIGWPLSEWRAHGVLRLEFDLRPEPKVPPGRGLVNPETVSPAFAFLQRLIRALPSDRSDEPFWSPAERPEWRSLSAELRRQKILEVLRREGTALGWNVEPDVRLDRSARRWLLWFPVGTPPPDFHRKLLALERRVRAGTDSTVELLLEGKEDRNQRSSREIKPHDLHPGS